MNWLVCPGLQTNPAEAADRRLGFGGFSKSLKNVEQFWVKHIIAPQHGVRKRVKLRNGAWTSLNPN
jgi:hypothetical protein